MLNIEYDVLNLQYHNIPTQYSPPNTKLLLLRKVSLRVWAAIFERYGLLPELVICSFVFTKHLYQNVCIDRGTFYLFIVTQRIQYNMLVESCFGVIFSQKNFS